MASSFSYRTIDVVAQSGRGSSGAGVGAGVRQALVGGVVAVAVGFGVTGRPGLGAGESVAAQTDKTTIGAVVDAAGVEALVGRGIVD
jgi:hypothetical protein